MRMNRWEWVARVMRTVFTRPRKRATPKTGREVRTFWIVDGSGTEHEVDAMTRSEARAMVKKALGVKSLRTMTPSYIPF